MTEAPMEAETAREAAEQSAKDFGPEADVRKASAETAADKDKYMKMLAKVGKELGLEGELLKSAEPVLSKALADRGSSDSLCTADRRAVQRRGRKVGRAAGRRRGWQGRAYEQGRGVLPEVCGGLLSEVDWRRGATTEAPLEAETAREASEQSVEDFGPEMEEADANLVGSPGGPGQ